MVLVRYKFSTLLLALVLLCALGAPAWAQTGSVSGQVLDPQGAAIAGTTVTLTESATKTVLTTSTNEAGHYTFVSVAPGDYTVTFTKTGFSVRKVGGQKVEVGQGLNINTTLELGSTSTVVEVSSVAGAQLQTMNSTVGQTIGGQDLLLLPNVGRDASTMTIYQPGVSPEGSVAGAMYDQNTFRLDGGNNTNDMDGSMNIYTPSFASNGAPTGTMPTPIESIEEFKVNTAGQTADFNGSSGSEVSMVTKRGTNQFHGAGYEYYFATDVGAANSWDNNHTPAKGLPYTPLPITHTNRFGAALGGPIAPKFLGGKTYFFFNYEGYRFPQSAVYQRTVPTDLMRAGVIQIREATGEVAYNLNPNPVTVNGVTYQPAMCPGGACDPRGIGLNPIVSQLWQKQMPLPNNFLGNGDHFNTAGYLSTIGLPQTTNNYVGRIDHDFGDKWRLMVSYRGFRWNRDTTSQVDIGGGIPGDKLGVPTPLSDRPSVPSYTVVGLTTNISPTMTNDFRFSYLRNYWAWDSATAPPQLPGLGGALEIGGESSNALIPYNVNTQNVRTRFWDGHDTMLRDDLTKIKGNHLIQVGGIYERNYDYHQRTDNGGGIMNNPVYQIGSGPGIVYPSQYVPTSVPSNQLSTYRALYSQVLGIVNQPQNLYTRSGPQLTLLPQGTPMFDQSTIPYYNIYVSDTWHMKPTFTLTYGLGYAVEMPPTEANGKQVELTDAAGKPIVLTDYLASRQSAALAGQVFNPALGFATVKNVTGGASTTYPYNPFYGGLSPRVSAAWSPKYADGILGKVFGDGKTVIRGGYGRIYGRLNGVALVLIPLLGTGLGQAVSCLGASKNGQCLGNGAVDPTTAFRIGTDGLSAPLPAVTKTLSQPYIPGGANAGAGAGTVIDPNFRPSRTENYNLNLQREFGTHTVVEVGYIGRLIRNEFQQVNLDSVPTMTTLNGQSFASAYSNLYTTLCGLGPSCANNNVTPAAQPFFEAALGGPTSAFCKGYASCTAAVAANSVMNGQVTQTQVYDFWATLNNNASWKLGRTMPSSPNFNGGAAQLSGIFSNASLGYGNYNAGYVSVTLRDWHGITTRSNLTYGRALGTGAQSQATSSYTTLNPWNLASMYGPQFYDYKYIYNVTMVYQPPYFKSQKGIAGHLLGGWTIAPLFSAHTGAPLPVYTAAGNCQSFGETNCSVGGSLDGAVLASAYTGGNSPHYNQSVTTNASANPFGVGVNTNTNNGGSSTNMFTNPVAAYNQFRPCVLGLDTSCSSSGPIRGMGFWNVDATVSKDIGIWKEGRVGATLLFQFTNVFNHVVMRDPYLDVSDPANFGVIGSGNPNGTGQVNTPRQIEFGLRVHF